VQRVYPIGAEMSEGGVHFRVWAPKTESLEVIIDNAAFALQREEKGYFSGLIKEAGANTRYHFRLNGNDYPDPASRYQPEGPSGPSQVIDPTSFVWTDQTWTGPSPLGQVIYEMHIGTFTSEGTWASAQRELQELADLGITMIEMMPINEFSGAFGWGYDGVNLYAPAHIYGHPHDLKSFIDHAHAIGISVILDVVYNHFGPKDNTILFFSDDYISHKHKTDWGKPINFDNNNAEQVREFFINNALYWIQEYHFDGLRIDAIQNIYDFSAKHILAEMTKELREQAAPKKIYMVGENEEQFPQFFNPFEADGYGLDALWNDDFHHTAKVRLTGHNEAYYCDYLGKPQEFISALKYGFLYQGQWYVWHKKYRGAKCLEAAYSCFIHFIQNHDQIANSAYGLRIHQISDPGNLRALTAVLLLGPATPLIFQGQEFAASAPFYYFADYPDDMAELVFQGRKEGFKKFATIALPEIQALLLSPSHLDTFQKCKLDLNERNTHSQAYQLHKDLLKLRKNDPVFNSLSSLDGSVINSDSFLLRFFGKEKDDRLMIINFGVDYILSPAPDPLLAPFPGTKWDILWSSESEHYGGNGTLPLFPNEHWKVLGHSAIVLGPKAVL